MRKEEREDPKDLHKLGKLGAVDGLHSELWIPACDTGIKINFKAQDSGLVRIKFTMSDKAPE